MEWRRRNDRNHVNMKRTAEVVMACVRCCYILYKILYIICNTRIKRIATNILARKLLLWCRENKAIVGWVANVAKNLSELPNFRIKIIWVRNCKKYLRRIKFQKLLIFQFILFFFYQSYRRTILIGAVIGNIYRWQRLWEYTRMCDISIVRIARFFLLRTVSGNLQKIPPLISILLKLRNKVIILSSFLYIYMRQYACKIFTSCIYSIQSDTLSCPYNV